MKTDRGYQWRAGPCINSFTRDPITIFSFPSATVGTAYSVQIPDKSESGKYILYRSSALPAGLSLDRVSGMITGSPTRSGRFKVTLFYSHDPNVSQAKSSYTRIGEWLLVVSKK